MEVEKKDGAVEVTPVSDKEKALAIEKAAIDKRNKEAEEQSRVKGFIKELKPLTEKWNVILMGKIETVGNGSTVMTRMDVVAQANPAKQDLSITDGN